VYLLILSHELTVITWLFRSLCTRIMELHLVLVVHSIVMLVVLLEHKIVRFGGVFLGRLLSECIHAWLIAWHRRYSLLGCMTSSLIIVGDWDNHIIIFKNIWLCLGLGSIYLSVYLSLYLCVDFYLKIYPVLHPIALLNNWSAPLAVKFIYFLAFLAAPFVTLQKVYVQMSFRGDNWESVGTC